MEENGMKIISFALLLLALPIAAAPASAKDSIKESDYPNQYEVMNTSKTSKLMVEKSCSMTLRDRAKPNVALNVFKKGYGSCQILDNGKVFHGRLNQKKNEIELVIPADKDKARVEEWEIVGTVDITPSANPTS
jgi:hypothetical protein